MRPTSQRGSALILAVVVTMIVAVIGVALIRFGSREIAGATAAQREQALVSCAEAGRRLILSRFRAIGASPLNLPALDEPIDASTRARVVGGHFDTADAAVNSGMQVTLMPDTAFGVDRGAVQTLSNRISLSGLGAKPLKVVVHCQMGGDGTPDSGRQLEVEFGLRFGL